MICAGQGEWPKRQDFNGGTQTGDSIPGSFIATIDSTIVDADDTLRHYSHGREFTVGRGGGGGGSGTVTSVGLVMPSQFTVSGSPVTTSGNLTAVFGDTLANYVFAGPPSGGASNPRFRALVAADIPSHDQAWSTITSTPITLSGYSISDTKTNFNTALSDGTFIFTGDAPTSHDFDVHSGSIDLEDIGSYAAGRMLYGGAADWTTLASGTENYVLKMGASYPAWGQVAFSELISTPTTIAGYSISDTKTNFSAGVSDGTILFVGDAPTAHATSHLSTGGDAISLFGTSSTTSGLVPGSNSVGATYYVDATGNWSIPAGGGVSTWLDLTDVNETDYTGKAGYVPMVEDGETAQHLVKFDTTSADQIPLSGFYDDLDEISKVGTPVDNQILIAVTDSTAEGDADLTFDGTDLTTTGTVTSTGFTIGSAAIVEAELEIIDGGTLTTIELNYVDGVTSAIQTQLNGKADLITQENQTGTTYTFVLGDAGKLVTLLNAAAITLTIPTNASVAFPINTVITFVQLGAGLVTVDDGSVTMNSYGAADALVGQYAVATLIKTDTDTWLLSGAIE